ncbi:exo-alpha-sialidase [Spirosoma soli]|uniref:Exo-alpha-sialidase n=1 Tax=Spirosoma soli TaxID=1770529 RepID=A0ABW5M193_9BACT
MKSLFIAILFFGLIAENPIRQITVSNPKFVGAVPRLTTDAAGNPLLSWVEKTGEKEAAFYFAVSKNDSNDGQGPVFGEKVRVKAPVTMSTHAEGMPKIAVKADGTILAVYEVPRPTAASRFAGDLLYTMSIDNGKTWLEPQPVHQDATPGKSHSFSNITRLPNGEIGVVWLDEKLPGQEGRPVKFAQTTSGKGFGTAVLVDDNACQCCRTNVFVDAEQRVHVTYRDLLPGAKVEIASRDISHAVSTDGGKTFSKPNVIYADHWQVNACPHAGPDVTQVGKDIVATWFSGKENAVGLRLARLGSDKLVASVLSNRAKHPQVATVDGQLVWLWDEAISKDGSNEMGTFVQRIAMQRISGQKNGSTTYLTPETINAAYPAVLATKDGLLVAYEAKKGEENVSIVVQLIDVSL